MQMLQPHQADAYPIYCNEHGHKPNCWEDLIYFDECGYGFVYVDGLGGFINPNGDVIIPLIYDHFAVFVDGHSRVRLNGK